MASPALRLASLERQLHADGSGKSFVDRIVALEEALHGAACPGVLTSRIAALEAAITGVPADPPVAPADAPVPPANAPNAAPAPAVVAAAPVASGAVARAAPADAEVQPRGGKTHATDDRVPPMAPAEYLDEYGPGKLPLVLDDALTLVDVSFGTSSGRVRAAPASSAAVLSARRVAPTTTTQRPPAWSNSGSTARRTGLCTGLSRRR